MSFIEFADKHFIGLCVLVVIILMALTDIFAKP